MSIRKRKLHSELPGFDETDTSIHVKRRRQRPIETGFASLSLDPRLVSPVTPISPVVPLTSGGHHDLQRYEPVAVADIPPVPHALSSNGFQGNPMDATLPIRPFVPTQMISPDFNDAGNGQSSQSEVVPEVSMKSSSWYEPEPDSECQHYP